MSSDLPSLHLSYDEAEAIAADHVRVWTGLTGLAEAPTIEAVTDMVQRTLRKAREIIAARDGDAEPLAPDTAVHRMHIAERDLPY